MLNDYMSAGGKSAGNQNYQEKSTSGEQNGFFSNIEIYQSANISCDVAIKGSLTLATPLSYQSGGTGRSTVGAPGQALVSTGSELTYVDVVKSVTLNTSAIPFLFVNSGTSSTITNTGTFTLNALTTGTGDRVVLQTSPILKTNVGLLSTNASTLTLQPSTSTSAYTWIFPTTIGTSGQVLVSLGPGNELSWQTPGTFGLGTVTSVSQTVPAFLSVSGSPITTSGTLAITLSGTALPTTSGGTGLTAVGTAGQILTSNGTTLFWDNNLFPERIIINSTICADVSVSQAAPIKGAIYNKGGLYMEKNFYIKGDYLEPFDTGDLPSIKDMNVIKGPVLTSVNPVTYIGASTFTIDGNPTPGTNVTFSGGSFITPTNVALLVKGTSFFQGVTTVVGTFTTVGNTALLGSNTLGTSVTPYIISQTLLGSVNFGTSSIPFNTSLVSFNRSNITYDKYSILKVFGTLGDPGQALYIGQDLSSTNSWLPSIIFQGLSNSQPLLTISVLEGGVAVASEPRITFGNLTNYSFDIINGTTFYGTRFKERISNKRILDVGVNIRNDFYYEPQIKMTTSSNQTLLMTQTTDSQSIQFKNAGGYNLLNISSISVSDLPSILFADEGNNSMKMTWDSTARRLFWSVSNTAVLDTGVTNDGNIPYFKMVAGNCNYLGTTSIWYTDTTSNTQSVKISTTGIQVGSANDTSSFLNTDGTVKCVSINIDQNLKVIGNIYVGPLNSPKITLNATGSLSTTAGVTVGTTLSVTGTSTLTGAVSTTAGLTVGETLSVTGTSTLTGEVSTTAGITVGGTLSVSGTSNFTGAVSTTAAVTIGGGLTVTGTSTLTGAVSTTAAVTVGGALTVTGSSTLTGSISAAGNLTLGGNFTVTGSSNFTGLLTCGGNFAVTGASTFTGLLSTIGGLNVGGALTVGGATTVAGALTATGLFTASGASTLTGLVTTIGGVNVGGALSVAGATNFVGATTTGGAFTVLGVFSANGASFFTGLLTCIGGATIGGLLTCGGAVTIGGALTVGGATTIAGIFTTNGASIMNGTLIVNGLTTINGVLLVNGAAASFLFPTAGAFLVNTGGGAASILTGVGAILLTTVAGFINLTTGGGAINLTTFTGGIGLYCNSGINDSITIQNSTTGDMQLTCGAGTIKINSNSGAIKMGAPNGGIQIGYYTGGAFDQNGAMAYFQVQTINGQLQFQTANITFKTWSQGSVNTGPGNFLVDTTNAYTGNITLTAKGSISLESLKGCKISGGFFTSATIYNVPTSSAPLITPESDSTFVFIDGGSGTYQEISLPSSLTYMIGSTFTFYNKSSLPITIKKYSSDTLFLLLPTCSCTVVLQENSNNLWIVNLISGTVGTVTSVSITVPSFMAVTGSPITTTGTFAISAESTGTGVVVLNNSPTFTGTVITSIISASGHIRWGGGYPDRPVTFTAGGAVGWNVTGGEGEVDFFNNYGTAGNNQYRFFKNNGSFWEPVFTIGNSGQIQCGNITVTTSSGDPLTLINTTDEYTVMNLGRALSPGNVAQIAFRYVGDNSASNAMNFGYYGKGSNLSLFNDLSSTFFGKVVCPNIEIGTLTRLANRSITSNVNFTLIYCANMGDNSSHLFCSADGVQGYVKINTNEGYFLEVLGWTKCETIISSGYIRWGQATPARPGAGTAGGAVGWNQTGGHADVSFYNNFGTGGVNQFQFYKNTGSAWESIVTIGHAGQIQCGNITVNTSSGDPLTLINTTAEYTVMNLGRALSPGNVSQIAFHYVGDNSPLNSTNFGYYGKGSNLELFNDQSSTFFGKVVCPNIEIGTLYRTGNRSITSNTAFTLVYCADRGSAASHLFCSADGNVGYVKINTASYAMEVEGALKCSSLTVPNLISGGTVGWGNAIPARPPPATGGGYAGWNQSGSNGEIAFYNNYGTSGSTQFQFYKNTGTAWESIVTIGHNGEISCSSIISSGHIRWGGGYPDRPVPGTAGGAVGWNVTGGEGEVDFFNNYGTAGTNQYRFWKNNGSIWEAVFTIGHSGQIQCGNITVTTSSGDPLTLINTTDEYTVMNLGRSLSPGNIAQIAFRYVANDSASNAMNFGYYGKATNLSLFNDLSSTFFGKVVCPNIEIGTLTRLANRSITSNVNFTLIYCANMGDNSSHLFCSADGSQGYVKINTNEGYFLQVLGWTKCETIISSGYLRWGQATPALPSLFTAGGAVGWNQTGGEAEVDFYNNFGTGGVNQFRFWKNNGGSNWESIVTIGHSGQIQCGNITVTTSSGDPLTLINTTAANTVMNLGRSLSPGNVSQIFFNYVGDNSTANSTNFGFYGKDTNLALYNDRSSVFFGNVLVATINSEAFTVLNQNNSLPNTDVTFGRENVTGNSGLLRYTQFGPNASNNVISLGFKGKLANLALTNDLNSAFRGNVSVTTSGGGDPLTLINTTDANTVINFGRALSTNNCGQLFFSYAGDNSDNNYISLGPYGKTPAFSITTKAAFSYASININGFLNCFRQTNSTVPQFGNHMVFNVSGGALDVGSISNNGANVFYNTSSDYRLKEDVQPLSGSIIFKLRPVSYKWKLNQSNGFGFIAHELQQHIPSIVVGSKDEVDDEGNPKHQAVDYSKLTPFLTAAIQEQQAVIEQQKNQIVDLQEKYQALLIRLELLEAGR